MRLLIVLLLAGSRGCRFGCGCRTTACARFGALTAEVNRRSEENGRLAVRNPALEAEVADLKEGIAAAEERARTELGMIQDGETFYQVAPAAPPSESASRELRPLIGARATHIVAPVPP